MSQWDVTGSWQARQGKWTITFTIPSMTPDGQFATSVQITPGNNSGTAFGRVVYDDFMLEVAWNSPAGTPPSIGAYHGKFDGSGNLHGSTYDRAHPESVAAWNALKQFVKK